MSSILQEFINDEQYRLFKISPKGIEEVDLDDILNDPEGFEEEMKGETSDDDLDSEEGIEGEEDELEGDDLEGEELETDVDDDGKEIEDQFNIDFGAPPEFLDVDDMDFDVGGDEESGPYDLHADNFDDDKSYNLHSPSYNREEEPNLAVNNITGMDGAEDLDDEDFDKETDGELNWDKDLDGMEMAPDSAGDEPEDEDLDDFDQDENHYGDDPSLMTHDKPSDFGPGGSLSRYQTDDFADGYFKDLPGDGADQEEESTDGEDNKDVNLDDEDEDSRLDVADSDLDFGFGDDDENEDEDLDSDDGNTDGLDDLEASDLDDEDTEDTEDEDDFEDTDEDEDLDDESELNDLFGSGDDMSSSAGETGDVDFDDLDTEDNEEGEDEEGEDDDMDNLDDDMDESEFGEDEEGEDEDPDFQGVIRTVKGAALVYKRQEQDGTFSELWIYTRGDGDKNDMKGDMKVRKAILAGTDIDSSTQMSDDGQQEVDTTSIGNVVFVKISGLPQ